MLAQAMAREARVKTHVDKGTAHKEAVSFLVSVATDYGRELLPEDCPGFAVIFGRLELKDMKKLFVEEEADLILDATHPYAQIVSENIKSSAEQLNIKYCQVVRSEEEVWGDVVTVKTMKKAAEYLKETEGSVLLTTGSKDLNVFTEIPGFAERLYPRMLPTPDIISQVLDMGYKKQNLICMQGPFLKETNIGIMKQIGAKFLVTKESGRSGGLGDKVEAAATLGVKIVVVGPPAEITGISLSQAARLCGVELVEKTEVHDRYDGDSRFPLYINMKEKLILMVGGGVISTRRAKVLRNFGCRIRMVAKAFPVGKIDGPIEYVEREFEIEDLIGADMVVAATDNRELNGKIGELCRQRHIPVNVASDKHLCDFYFPGIVRRGNLTIGVIAGGKDHKKASKIRRDIENMLREQEALETIARGRKGREKK